MQSLPSQRRTCEHQKPFGDDDGSLYSQRPEYPMHAEEVGLRIREPHLAPAQKSNQT